MIKSVSQVSLFSFRLLPSLFVIFSIAGVDGDRLFDNLIRRFLGITFEMMSREYSVTSVSPRHRNDHGENGEYNNDSISTITYENITRIFFPMR